VYSFGKNDYGQLGLGDENNRDVPEKLTKLPIERATYIKIACGSYHTLLIDDKNQLYSVGLNHCGQLGLGNTNNRS